MPATDSRDTELVNGSGDSKNDNTHKSHGLPAL